MIRFGNEKKQKRITNDLLRKAASLGNERAEAELNRRKGRYGALADYINEEQGRS